MQRPIKLFIKKYFNKEAVALKVLLNFLQKIAGFGAEPQGLKKVLSQYQNEASKSKSQQKSWQEAKLA